MKRYWLGLVLPLLAAVPSAAQEQAAPPLGPPVLAAAVRANRASRTGRPARDRGTEAIDLTEDRTQRMTVPVSIGGRGPYRLHRRHRRRTHRHLARAGPAARPRPRPYRHRPFSMTEVEPDPDRGHPGARGRPADGERHPCARARAAAISGAEGMLGVDSLQIAARHLRFRPPGDDRHAVAPRAEELARRHASSSPRAAATASSCSSTPRSTASGSG